jgi:hypothetical protein
LEADWSVEMGHGDEVLEFPWAADAPGVRFYDLKGNPDLLDQVAEAIANPVLRQFLASVNAPSSGFQTAKCDVWCIQQAATDDHPALVTCACYVDVLFDLRSRQTSLEHHERLVRELCTVIEAQAAPAASAEFIVRRCFYHRNPGVELEPGCYVTCYVHGHGPDERLARQNWATGLRALQEAFMTCDRASDRPFR